MTTPLRRLHRDAVTARNDGLRAIREGAAGLVESRGLPTSRDEGWRFTPLSALDGLQFEPGSDPAQTREDCVAAARPWVAPDAASCVLVDGVPMDTAPLAAAGLRVHTLAVRGASELPSWFGKLSEQWPFAALNAAMLEDCLVVEVPAKFVVERVVQLVHLTRSSGAARVAYPRVVIALGEGSRLELVETFVALGDGPVVTNAVCEAVIGCGASFVHGRVVEGRLDAFHLGCLAVRQDSQSHYASRVASVGGALSRLDLRVELAGPEASCILDGVGMAAHAEHVDFHTEVDHQVPRCSSAQDYRAVVDGNGRAVFDGTAFVRRDASGTRAHQKNRNLLLSDQAVANTKPHLQIDTDEVECSHGATVGTLDDDQLFYLRARGLDEATARAILTFGFVEAIVDRLPLEVVREHLQRTILERLPDGKVVREALWTDS